MTDFSHVDDLIDTTGGVTYNTVSTVWSSELSNGTVAVSAGITSIDYTILTGVPDYYTTAPEIESAPSAASGIGGSSALATAINIILGHGASPTGYECYFADVANITFNVHSQPTTTSDDVGAITFGEYDPTVVTGYADAAAYNKYLAWQSPVSDTRLQGDIWINNSLPGMTGVTEGSPGFFVLMHEIGHALGLQHPGGLTATDEYNAKYTIMAEIDPDHLSNFYSPDMSYGTDAAVDSYTTGLQLYDVAAVQEIYGRNYDTRVGDDVYSVGHGFGAADDNAFTYTIWDGAGTDIIDASGYDTPVQIDLRQGHFSSIGLQSDSGSAILMDHDGEDAGNVAIAFYTVIENAVGTDQNDTLVGNEWTNVLYGGGGNDTIYGDGVMYDGQAGFHDDDTHRPGDAASADLSGYDVLLGGYGDDHLYGGLGNDIIHGGYNQTDIDGSWAGIEPWDPASQFSGCYADIAYSADGTDTADYSNLNAAANVAYAGGSIWIDAIVTGDGNIQVDKISGITQIDTDRLFSIEHLVGTANNDIFIVNHSPSGSAPLVLDGGAGNDAYYFEAGTSGATGTVEINDGAGINTVDLTALTSDYITGESTWVNGVEVFDLQVGASGSYFTIQFDTGVQQIAIDYGTMAWGNLVNYFYFNPGAVVVGDLYDDVNSWLYSTGITGAVPIYDLNGNIVGQEVNPSIGGSPISSSVAYVIYHPLVVTAFSETGSGPYSSTATLKAYEKEFLFLPSIDESDVRITANGTQGNAALTIHIDSLSYTMTVSDFEAGHPISGISVYGAALDDAINGASSAVLTNTSTNIFSGSYTTANGLGVDPGGSANVTYYLEELAFMSGGSVDLTAPLTFTGSSSADTLTGLDDRADTIYGMGGSDTIHGYGGDDTIIGGASNDNLYGDLGNDTFVFASGWGADTVHESLSSGTDAVSFTGIDPSDIRMYTDSSGNLHLVEISNSANTITVTAGITGNNTDESTIGQYVESVTFDDTNHTTWDLTGALTITGGTGNDTLYGTAYNDTIYGMDGQDTIRGNAGNDTIIGGASTDTIYGGPGNDTFVYASGWGADTIHENLSEGTDTISFAGIDPSDIRMYTDSAGNLHLVEISNSANTINVVAGITGSNTDESTIGQYVESVTFDDTNHTTWDLTGALTITGGSGNDTLYGTAYNDTIYGMAGTNTMYGNAGNDTLNGGSGTDVPHGGPGNDILYGDAGSDTLYGDAGADTFLFMAATAFSGSDSIADFSTSAGDKIDIKDVISGYDPATMAITDWVQITTSGSNSILKVDTDGTGSGHTWQQIASILGVTGLTDEAALVASGNLIVHT